MQTQSKIGTSQWEKFAKSLLTTTCLGVAASGGAYASTIVEGTVPAPSDFPNSSPGFLLPLGTTVVQGQLHQTTDNSDWFEFQDLAPGTGFSLLGKYNPLHQERGVSFEVFDSLGQQIGITTLEGQGRTVNATVPVDGDLIVDVHFAQSGNPTYEFDLTATVQQTPEPAVGLGAGLALATALAWKRKRDQAKSQTQA
jgi:hypothetical protein